MDEVEVAALLGEPRTGVLSVSASDGGPPLSTPLWFAHRGGVVVATTARTSAKVRWLRRTGRATFLVQSDVPPRHVALEVDVDVVEADEATRREIAARYVPADGLDAYMAQTAAADVVQVRMQVTRVRSADLSKAVAP